MATRFEGEIANAVARIIDVGFVDPAWIEKSLNKYLEEFRFDRTSFQKYLNLSPYPKNIPSKIGKLIREATGLSHSALMDRVASLGLQDKHARAIAMFFRSSRLRDLGFPLYAINDVAGLFALSLYRFAYGSNDRLEPEQEWAALDFRGAYKLFLKRAGSENIDSRIVLSWLDDHPSAIMTLEISRAINGQIRVRMGPTAPAFDFQTVLLSDQFDPRTASIILEDHYDQAIRDAAKINLTATYKASNDVTLMQSQSLQVYALRNEESGVLTGTFHWKGEVGKVVGRKLDSITEADITSTKILLKDQLHQLAATDIDLIQRLTAVKPSERKLPILAR